jgi:hypothetical protein
MLVCIFATCANPIEAATNYRLEEVPEIGSPAPTKKLRDTGVCMVSPGQMDRCAHVEIRGITYTVAFRRKPGSRKEVVTYVHTDDQKFRTKNGKRVGDTLIVLGRSTLTSAPGFEIYADGAILDWQPVVGFNGLVKTVHDGVPDSDVEIRQISQDGATTVRIKGFTKR